VIRPGRKSAAQLAAPPINGGQPRLEPPEFLSETERKLFVELIEACAPEHFVRSDLPLLTAFVQAIELSRSAIRRVGDDPTALQTWERAVKVVATLATRLRLSPQSRSEPRSVARHLPSALPRPWVE
jgi:phage terminase small subunit